MYMSKNKQHHTEYMREWRQKQKKLDLPESDVMAAAEQAPNGALFSDLYTGQRSADPDNSVFLSALVVAMCLMYFSGHDVETVDRICRKSEVLRDVWDKPYKYGFTLGGYVLRQAHNLQQPRRVRHA